jgi:hypothetical protein
MKKFTSGATTAAGVALANFNSMLWVAFTGGGGLGAAAPNYKLNIMPVDPNNPTDAWSFERLLVLESETTMEQPALAAFNGKLWLAWTGTDAVHRIYMMPLTVNSDNRLTAGQKIAFDWTATGGLSLAVRHVWVNQSVQQQLFLTFCGGGGLGGGVPNGEVNFAYSVDGTSWPESQLTVLSRYRSLQSPSSTEVPVGAGLPSEPPYMFTAFTGTNNNLYLSGPSGYLSILKYIGDHVLETSNYAPAIGAFNNSGTWDLFYVWTGSGSNRHLYYQDGLGFSSQDENYHSAYSDTSAFAPAVLGVDWHRYVAWAGTDAAHRLNIAEFSELEKIPS